MMVADEMQEEKRMSSEVKRLMNGRKSVDERTGKRRNLVIERIDAHGPEGSTTVNHGIGCVLWDRRMLDCFEEFGTEFL